jgi:hypothetical protein
VKLSFDLVGCARFHIFPFRLPNQAPLGPLIEVGISTKLLTVRG